MTTDAITLDQLSKDTGEPVERLRQWHELGLLPGDPKAFPVSHIERVRLIRFATERGISAESLAELERSGGLLDFFIETRVSADRPGSYSFEEVAERLGLEPDRLERFRIAAGLRDQPRAYQDDVDTMTSLLPAFFSDIPEDALLQMIRVMTDSSNRVAEAINRLFHLYVHEAFRSEGKSGRDLLEATRAVGEPLQGLVEPAVLYFHRKAWDRALREDLLLHLAEEFEAPAAVPGQMVRVILFSDLSGFTPLTEAMGDAAAVQIVNRFADLVRDVAETHGGQVIKPIGDAFMLAFADAKSSVLAGLAIEDAASKEPNFPAIRSGAHRGLVVYREADYLGATVNTAARVAGIAEGHQLLVTDAVRMEAGDLPELDYSFLGRRELKGVPHPVDVYLVEASVERPHRVIDPACGMELDPERAAAELTWQGEQYWFCSPGCLQKFAAAPEHYASKA